MKLDIIQETAIVTSERLTGETIFKQTPTKHPKAINIRPYWY